ncbi:MAG: hypothetical protein KC561_03415 [Myxococcales bacterium]|nr:hypothetical protein [Myxococcales bacterium]
MEPGNPAEVIVTFIEDRNGRALVRLPNGSKTSLDYDCLVGRSGKVHFLARPEQERPWFAECLVCEQWVGTGVTHREAADAFEDHWKAVHGTAPTGA